MKITQPEQVTRTYCDECGDECRGTIVNLDNKSYCQKRECRGEWDKFTLMDRVIGDIKDQPYYA